QDDELNAFLFGQRLQYLGDAQRLDALLDDQDAAGRADGQRGADGFLRLLRADRHGDDLLDLAGFFQADGLFDGDFVERVHRHLNIGGIDARSIGLDPDLDVIVDDPLD